MNCPRCDYKLDEKSKECSRCGIISPKTPKKAETKTKSLQSQFFNFLKKDKIPQQEIAKKVEPDFSDLVSILQNHIKAEPKQTPQKVSPDTIESPFKSAVQRIVNETKEIEALPQIVAEILATQPEPAINLNDSFDSFLDLLDFGNESTKVEPEPINKKISELEL